MSKFIKLNYEKIVLGLIIIILLIVFMKIIQSDVGEGAVDIELDRIELENEKYRDLGENPLVRVIIMTDEFKSIFHDSTVFEGEDLEILYGDNWTESKSLGQIELKVDDSIFEGGSIKIQEKNGKTITFNSIKRNYGVPEYEGEFEIYSTKEGIVVVNEITLESYLRSVVPSEMPATYELEALKAQAVCARSYAYMQMQKISYGEFGAHMDDSVSYQVYNNLNTSDKTDLAITETAGEKVGVDGKVVTTYFYSTSSGHTTDLRAWGSDSDYKNSYIQGIPVSDGLEDYEKNLPWYAWEIVVSKDILQQILVLNLNESIGKLDDVVILTRGSGDVALSIEFVGDEGSVTVEGENAIRKALGSNKYNIIKNDNTSIKGMDLLPSAFFTIEAVEENYRIKGGGLGHGIGMSQNGANEMAKAGIGYEEIIHTFYQNIEMMY